MVKSAISEMLGIRYPVFQGGMAWIADGKLAAAVSNGGGLGIIAAGNASGSYVREQIRIAKSRTDKPIGVNIMLMSPFADEVAKVVTEENVVGGKIVFRGTAYVDLLFIGQDSQPYSQVLEMPFAQYGELDRDYDKEASGSVTMAIFSS